MTVYFTSDWHLWHTNIIKYAKRPFENASDMNKTILDNFFDTVIRGSTVYFLGDFAFGSASRHQEIRGILKDIDDHCKFHVILGNHDHRIQGLLVEECESVAPLKEIKIGSQKITLCHYPMHSFNGSHHNNWQLYGHHHRDTNTIIPGKRYNVCLEANYYRPISFEELHAKMSQREDNWDFIPPERRRRQQDSDHLRKELAKEKKKLASLRGKMNEVFLEKAPEKVVSEAKMYLARQETLVEELEEKLDQNP